MFRQQFNFVLFRRASHDDQRGQTIVEFALTFLLVVTVVFGTIEFCSLIYTYTVMADAANEGLRYAIVHSSDTSGTQAIVQQYAAYSLHDTSSITVTVTCAGTCAPTSDVTITVSYPYVPYLSYIMSSPPTLSAYAEGQTVF
jgi:Flp pilus assembly protein TadG